MSYQGIDNPGASSGAQHVGEKSAGAGGAGGGRATWKWVAGGLVLVAVVVGAVVGGVVGSNAAKGSGKDTSSSGGSGSSGGSSGSASGESPSATGESGPTVSVTPLATWDYGTDKLIGMNVGNWLILERWMDEDWFTSTASQTAWDEWTFCEQLGTGALAALQQHWIAWFTESDMETLYQAGINHVRLPLGFWALIDTQGDEPYVQGNQMDFYMNATMWAWKRGMYVLFDMHGLPGSQDGEQQSGHNTTEIDFYNSTNQARADQFLAASLDWIAKNPYRSAISSIGVANEPRPWNAANFAILAAYYQRSYDTIQKAAYPIPMVFHHGFPTNVSGVAYWEDFASARVTTPPSLVIEDHPYPGNFPPQTDTSDIMTQVCNDAKLYIGYPIPVAITEWSLYTGVTDATFMSQFYAAQAVAWAWSAGGMYWAAKLVPTQAQLAANINYTAYSFETLLSAGVIPKPGTSGEDFWTYLGELGNATCGAKPATATVTYPQGTTSSWAAAASETNAARRRRAVDF